MVQLVLLTILAVQNTVLVLLMKLLASSPVPGTIGVVAVELLKLVACLVYELYYHHQTSFNMRDLSSYIVPALCYAVQNNLCLMAIKRLGPVEYQVIYQAKILTTALFANWMLKTPVKRHQWVALFILTGGVVTAGISWRSNDYGRISHLAMRNIHDHVIGLCALIMASMTSGFAGVFLERKLKHSKPRPTVTFQTIALSLFSLPVAVLIHAIKSGDNLTSIFFTTRELSNYLLTPRYLVIFAVQASSGILVGAVMKYSSNVMKGFATSISLVLSALLTRPGGQPIMGAVLVSMAVLIYFSDPKDYQHFDILTLYSGRNNNKYSREKRGNIKAV